MDILHTTSSGDLGVLALGLVIAGLVGGLVAGMLGVGGGIVVVPVLYHVMATLGVDQSVRMHVAIGTSLACAVVGLFAVGFFAAKLSLRNPWIKGLEIVSYGCVIFGLSYLAGHFIPPLFGHAPVSVGG